MCIIETNPVGYLIGLAGPTVVLAAALYFTLTSEEPVLTETQQDAFETLGLSTSGQRVLVAVVSGGSIMVSLPFHFVSLRECLSLLV